MQLIKFIHNFITMMLTTQIVNKTTVVMLALFLSLVAFAQEKETIYIKYEAEKEISDTLEQVYFHIKPRYFSSQYEFDSFIFDKQKHKAVKISYCDIKDKLISKKEANLKVEKYLLKKKEELEKKTNLKGDFLLTFPIYFSSAFEKVYIYHIQTETLYEVSWESSIGCQ